MSIPGNSDDRWAAISSIKGTKRQAFLKAGVSIRTHCGSESGTLTRAKACRAVSGSCTIMPSEIDRFEMNGNGCPTSTDSGVSIGKIIRSNRSSAAARSSPARSFHPRRWTSRRASAGRMEPA